MREHIQTHTDSSPLGTAHKHNDNTDIHTSDKAESPVGVQGRLLVSGVLHNNLLLSGQLSYLTLLTGKKKKERCTKLF